MTALDTVRAWCAGFQGRPLPDPARLSILTISARMATCSKKVGCQYNRDPSRQTRIAIIEAGGCIFFRGHTYLLCTSRDDAQAWVEASQEADASFAAAFAEMFRNAKRTAIVKLYPNDEGAA